MENRTSGRAPRKHFHSGGAKCSHIASGGKPLLKRGEAGCQGREPAPAGRTAKAGDGGRRSPMGWRRRGYRAAAVISQRNRLRLACHDPGEKRWMREEARDGEENGDVEWMRAWPETGQEVRAERTHTVFRML